MCASGFNKLPIKRGTFTVSGLFIIVYMQPNLFEIIIGIVLSWIIVFPPIWILQVSPLRHTPWNNEENFPVVTSPIIVAFVATNSDSKSLGKVFWEVGIQRVEGTTKKFIYYFH